MLLFTEIQFPMNDNNKNAIAREREREREIDKNSTTEAIMKLDMRKVHKGLPVN